MEAKTNKVLPETLRELIQLDLCLLETLPFPWGLQEGNTDNSFINRTLPQPETMARLSTFDDIKASGLAETYLDFDAPTIKFGPISSSEQLHKKELLLVSGDQPAQYSTSQSAGPKILNDNGVASNALVHQEIWQRLRVSFALILQGR